jgi:hypothetical protein
MTKSGMDGFAAKAAAAIVSAFASEFGTAPSGESMHDRSGTPSVAITITGLCPGCVFACRYAMIPSRT